MGRIGGVGGERMRIRRRRWWRGAPHPSRSLGHPRSSGLLNPKCHALFWTAATFDFLPLLDFVASLTLN